MYLSLRPQVAHVIAKLVLFIEGLNAPDFDPQTRTGPARIHGPDVTTGTCPQ